MEEPGAVDLLEITEVRVAQLLLLAQFAPDLRGAFASVHFLFERVAVLGSIAVRVSICDQGLAFKIIIAISTTECGIDRHANGVSCLAEVPVPPRNTTSARTASANEDRVVAG